MKTNRIMKMLLVTTALVLSVALAAPGTAEAASPKAVKSVALKIGAQKVTKKTYIMQKGQKAALKVAVNPSKAKKSVTFKSSNKKIATVDKKGKITAKKTGTAKITVTVKGKNKKKKITYVKIKVVKKHKHVWKNTTKQKYVMDERAWDEEVWEEKCVCYGNKLKNESCDFYCDTYEEMAKHIGEMHHSYGIDDVKVGVIHHDETGHYETVITGRKCKICGATTN